MKTKIFAILTAVMMMAIAGATVVNFDDASADDPQTTYGVFKIWTYENSTWSSTTVSAYDGALAIQAYAIENEIEDCIIDMATATDDEYPTINTNYGNITQLGNETETALSTDKWYAQYYNLSTGWQVADDALGFYKPFADYVADHTTANIAIFFGSQNAADNAFNSLSSNMALQPIVSQSTIDQNADFAVSFYFKINLVEADFMDLVEEYELDFDITVPDKSTSDLFAGLQLTGYGSDLYSALVDAIGIDVNADTGVPTTNHGSYNTFYSWINSLFGLSSVQTQGSGTQTWNDDVWAWWVEYYTYGNSSVRSSFVVGYYSPLDEAPNTHDNFAFIFDEGAM